ncbi:hypothetical protein HDV57DRAFT_185642 [Trichoderma longibrachiatum]|uniref:Extracellular membrane protein CFEM domain-containing protein n=1 Tax=Trichoderma longibrachiatum ATCC 18648 TaxID=983965 RepID=A0A2T4BZC3_TRILO|nr:hypothetical protein M440DRAFT_1358985 [Trichoderma longibrachiatum ATCC 18648]
MFLDRMSRRLSSYMLLLFFITLISTATAAPLNSGGIDSFVPSCAAQCFDSFLKISYADRPPRTLAALCPRLGANGFTIGEAAVQCLVAERAAGACSKGDASDAVIDRAFFMCFGQPGAISPTHSVITATLAVPITGTGPITFPPASKTRSTTIPTAIPRQSQSSLSLPPTLVTDPTSLSSLRPSETRSTSVPTTKSASRTRQTSSSGSSTSSTTSAREILTTDPVAPTFTFTSTSATETSTSTDVPDDVSGGQGKKDSSISLSTGQIAGIAIGSIAGVGLIGFGIAVFCRCLRRRSRFGRKWRKGGRPLRDSGSFGTEKGPHGGGGGGGGTDSWITNQLRAPLNPGPVPTPTRSWYNRASWRPSAIGLAISPSHTRDVTRAPTPTSARPLSKLLPAKPVMDRGPPKLEVSLPSRDGDSHFGAATIMGAAAGAASGAAMSGAIPASSSQKPTQPKAEQQHQKPQPLPPSQIHPALREPATAQPSIIRPRNLTPPQSKQPQSPLPLKLLIPKTGNFKPFVPVVTRHDSSTTEFEEDGRISVSPVGQVWRPPSDDPPSAAAPYYVADRSGNWRLGDPARAKEIAELEASVSPLTAAPRSAAPKLVAGLGLATEAAGALALVKAASQRRDNDRAAEAAKASRQQNRQSALGINMAPEKTIRAVEPSLSSDEEIQEREREQQPYAPRPLFSGVSNNNNNSNFPRRSSTHRLSSTRSLTRPRITSTDSGVTTISTSTDDTDLRSPHPPPEQPGSLSPVVESPQALRPREGRSPTQYPKIPASLQVTVPAPPPSAGNARPAQASPSFGAPLAAGTMSSADGNMPRQQQQQGRKLISPRLAQQAPDAIRTGSPMMRSESAPFRPDNSNNNRRYVQPPRSNTLPQQQQDIPSSSRAAPRTYPPQQQQRQPAQFSQRPPSSNNYSKPYRLPPHPTAYRPSIDSSGYPYQTRLSDLNPQTPSTYNLPYPPQTNRYPHHHPRNHQPPFTQQQQRPQPQPQPQRQQLQQRRQQQQQQQPQPQQNLSIQPSSTNPPLQPPLLTTTSATSSSSASTSSSSLLAKRLGPSRAANLSIPVPQSASSSIYSTATTTAANNNNNNNNINSAGSNNNNPSARSKWLRHNSIPFPAASAAQPGEQQTQGRVVDSPKKFPPPPQEPAELPATPVWKPRLTPTRRGDDLFLIAQ